MLSLWPLVLGFFGYRLQRAGSGLGGWGTLLRAPGLLCLGLAILLLLHNLPFRYPKYDQYHGDQGIGPYQDLIDYASERGALTFWAHPEVDRDEFLSTGIPFPEGLSQIRMKTPAYYKDLLRARGYTGIAVFAEGLKEVIPPGGVWDQLLTQYLDGERERPVWGIAEVDFEDEDSNITSGLTYLWVKDVSQGSVIEALRQGRAYAAHGPHVQNIALESFTAESADGKSAGVGEEIEVSEPPRLRFRTVTANEVAETPTEVLVIRNGFEVYRDQRAGRDIDWTFEDTTLERGKRAYYRLDINLHQSGRIVTNPIFVNYL